jgi:glucose-1-phosphate thymidylyltransferase
MWILLGRGFTWLDTGTHESLADATDFVKMVEQRQGMQISCLEEIAYINNWIDKKTLLESAKRMGKSSYGQYLQMVADGKIYVLTMPYTIRRRNYRMPM